MTVCEGLSMTALRKPMKSDAPSPGTGTALLKPQESGHPSPA